MYNAEEFVKSIPIDAEQSLEALPYDVARRELYTARDLFEAFDPADPASLAKCLDARIAAHVAATGQSRPRALELRARTMHDVNIRSALYRMLDWYEAKRVVGIMGGHAVKRTDPAYRTVVEVAKKLTERGMLMISGGGPGAMEATHVGAWLAGRPDADIDRALTILAAAPSHTDAYWLSAAYEVMASLPQESGFVSISIPTWHFSNEPPNPFATYIAKLFENSLREDLLLAESYGGLVFMPGGPGTIQEVFQQVVQYHYIRLGSPSPMVFVGRAFWTDTLPVYPLIVQLLAKGIFKNLAPALVETTTEIVAAFA